MKLKPEVKVGRRQMNVSMPEDVAALLEEYREALGADTTVNYVITEIVRGHIEADKEFQKLRAERLAKGNNKAAAGANTAAHTTTPPAAATAAPAGSGNPTGGAGANGRAHASA